MSIVNRGFRFQPGQIHMGRALNARLILLVAAVLAAGCTVKKSTPPALAGPSELGLSLSMAATPDVLTQDGQSQSVVRILARDATGAPVPNLTIRLDLSANVGSLNTKSAVTGGDGRASVTYTAPAVVDPSGLGSDLLIQILATAVGTNAANNATPNSVTIRLVPPGGTLLPPGTLTAGFTFTPAAPTVGQSVVFNAPPCKAQTDLDCTFGPIVSYTWNFGDGTSGSGQVTSHTFTRSANYAVTLTVMSSTGQTAVAVKEVPVEAGTAPTADFVFSPTAPTVGLNVFFNASASAAAAGRTIVSYRWDFGTGDFSSGVTTLFAYGAAGTYKVTLTVIDDIGQAGTVSKDVVVK